MKCPYCSDEMEKGYIKSSRFIHWGTENELGLCPDDITLSPNGLKEGVKAFLKAILLKPTAAAAAISLSYPLSRKNTKYIM